jgi:phosphatidylglycerol:prolipoprotein diacylglycerol transferase
MVFPGAGPLPRHPSALYEAVLESIVLGVIVWVYARKRRASGAVTGLFLIVYGVIRTAIECLREPDQHIGLLMFGLTMGQLLSIPMILIGLYLMMRKEPTQWNNI